MVNSSEFQFPSFSKLILNTRRGKFKCDKERRKNKSGKWSSGCKDVSREEHERNLRLVARMKCLQRIRFDYSIDTLFAYVQTSQSSEVRRVQDFLRAYDEIMCHRIFSVPVVARATDRFEPRWNVPLGVERGFWVVCRITRSHKTSPEHNTAIKKE